MVKSLIKTIAFLLALASICGLLVLKFDLLQYATAGRNLQKYEPSSASIVSEACRQNFQNIFNTENIENTLKAVSVVVHKNGEAISCGETGADSKFYDQLLTNFASEFGHCPKWLSKYQVESLLTRSLSQLINTCVAPQQSKKGLLGFCDAGPKKTPILLDHQKLIPVRLDDNTSSLPCHFHTREGLRITSLKQLSEMTQKPVQDCEKIQDGDEETQTCKALDENSSFPSKIHLYAVPAGRVFMFAPSYVGEIFHLPHVEGADEKLVYLEVLSLNPRVFDVFNFFSREESQELVDKAKNETSESHRIKRSSTGATGYNINSRRTSESGFDTHGATARKVKKRCFSALGFDEYLESHSDGLQILRYNLTAAYNSHMDWIEDNPNVEHDYQSAGVGGNRFATILMYMTDLEPENGGETVFPKGLPFGGESVDQKEALAELRESEQGKVLEPNSWEEKLVTLCRTKLAIRPHSSRAVLFYSQFPDGRADPASLHGK